MRRGKSSSLPASISNIRTHLENPVRIPKLQLGPTSDSPGPILFNVARTAEKFVVKSLPSIETRNTDVTSIRIKVMK